MPAVKADSDKSPPAKKAPEKRLRTQVTHRTKQGPGKRGPDKGSRYEKLADKEIRRLREPHGPEYLIPRAAFARLVKDELCQQQGPKHNFKISSEALRLLQWSCEAAVSEHMSRAAFVAGHAKRCTVTLKDFHVVQCLRPLLPAEANLRWVRHQIEIRGLW